VYRPTDRRTDRRSLWAAWLSRLVAVDGKKNKKKLGEHHPPTTHEPKRRQQSSSSSSSSSTALANQMKKKEAVDGNVITGKEQPSFPALLKEGSIRAAPVEKPWLTRFLVSDWCRPLQQLRSRLHAIKHRARHSFIPVDNVVPTISGRPERRTRTAADQLVSMLL
jgi:hypothetical protein